MTIFEAISLLVAGCSMTWAIAVHVYAGRRPDMKAIYNKLDEVQRALYTIREDYVKHGTCAQRQEKCPCVEDIKELKQKVTRR